MKPDFFSEPCSGFFPFKDENFKKKIEFKKLDYDTLCVLIPSNSSEKCNPRFVMSKITSRDIKSHQLLLCFKAGEEVSESRRCKEVDCQLQILEYYKDHVASFVDDIDMNRLRMSKSDLLRETKNSLTLWSGESVWRKYGEIKTFINNKVNFFLRQLLDPSFHLKSGWNMDRLRRCITVHDSGL